MIVAGTDEEAKLLDRCLGGVVSEDQVQPENREIDLTGTDGLAKHVDGLFVTITQPHEGVRKVAEKYGAIISEFRWTGDFVAARNFNFSQVPKEYDFVIWTDSDDLWKNPQLIRGVAESAYQKNVDGVWLQYKYSFDPRGNVDTMHWKNRILRNNDSHEWIGDDLHEDLSPLRQLSHEKNKEIEVIHLTDKDRLKRALHRNTEISEAALARSPKDPRRLWNLANCYLSLGKYSSAVGLYLDFLETSNSDEERFMAWHRLGLCYLGLGQFADAVQAEQGAFWLRPSYPDTYFALGYIYYQMNKFREAREMFETGLTKKPAEDTYIVWDPREYDYKPRYYLAQTYIALNKPKDALKNLELALPVAPDQEHIKKGIELLKPEIEKFDKAEAIFDRAKDITDKEEMKKLLDDVPADMKYYPAIISLRNRVFPKTESSGKDVVFYCGLTDHEWSPVTFREKGVGGSEEAVVQLAKRWARDGWNVTVYANVGPEEIIEDGVVWKPALAWNPKDKNDVTILWRTPRYVDFNINSPVILLDIHDVVPPSEFPPERLERITKVMFKSNVQREYYPNIPNDKAVVINHGVDVEQFIEREKEIVKNPYQIINTSSPDRGILTTMEIIRRVHSKLSDELKKKLKFVYHYGFKIWDTEFSDNSKMLAWKAKAEKELQDLKDLGIATAESGPMISQNEIVDKYLESGIGLYPSEFAEIGFIGGKKMAVAGAIPFTTDVFAQGEFLKDGTQIHSDVTWDNWTVDIESGLDYGVKKEEQINEFVDKIVEYMNAPEKYEEQRKLLTTNARSKFSWDKCAKSWADLFNGN